MVIALFLERLYPELNIDLRSVNFIRCLYSTCKSNNISFRNGDYLTITPSDISIIFHMIRKPNSIIVLLFIQNNSQFKNIAKTSLTASMLSLSSIVYVQVCPAPQIFSKQQMSPSELSSYCFCYVFNHYFAQFQLQFLLLKRVNCLPFQFLQREQLNLVPRSSRLTVH